MNISKTDDEELINHEGTVVFTPDAVHSVGKSVGLSTIAGVYRPEVEPPAYYLHLRHTLNCGQIRNTQAGQKKMVLVLREGDSTATPRTAVATRSLDGEFYSVVVTLPDGSQAELPTEKFEDILKRIEELNPQ